PTLPHLSLHSFPTRRSSDLGASMILAGDLGGTKSNLAIFTSEGGRLHAVAEQSFLNHSYAGIEEIVKEFLAGHDCIVTQACLGRSGEHTSELQSRGHLVCRL